MEKKKNYDLLTFLAGLVMLVAGFFIFSSKVTVTTGFGFFVGGYHVNGGLVVIPMLIGIVWWFINPKSIPAKIITFLGLILIVLSVIMNTRFYFHESLFNYILMLVLMVGGMALVLKVLFKSKKE